MKLAILCSSGGAVFETGVKILKENGYCPSIVVLTDRQCGAEFACERLGIKWRRIEEKNREHFSETAANWLLNEAQVDFVWLFFSRLISRELYDHLPCFNFHPSLLPAFRGFKSVENALQCGARFLGATVHVVDESIDNGRILCQTIAPIMPEMNLEALQRLSFAQKVYLFLLLYEMSEGNLVNSSLNNKKHLNCKIVAKSWANPSLQSPDLIKAFDDFLHEEGILWVR